MPPSRKVTSSQLEELVSWMELHPLQARATQLCSPQAKQLSHRLWEELASRHNAVGDGVTKTVKEWRQYWSDQKCKIKKKGSAMRQHGSGTGGGPSWDGILTPIEDRILSIMGVQNVTGNPNVRIDVDMGFDISPSPPAVPLLELPLLELPLSRPVTPAPSTSGHPTLDVAERENVSPPNTQPSPHTASQARPPKRKRVTVADADADEPPERSRPHITAAPPRWLLDLETRRIREMEMQRELEGRRLEVDAQRLAIDTRRLAVEEAGINMQRELGERRLAMDARRLAVEEAGINMQRELGERRLAMDARRLAVEESALSQLLAQPLRPPSPFQ